MISLKQLPVNLLRKLKLRIIEIQLGGGSDPVLDELARDISREIVRRVRGGKVKPVVRRDVQLLRARLLNVRSTGFSRIWRSLRR
jgi:predicted hydrocarbon binding protein